MAQNPFNETVMDHFMHPRNVGEIENADAVLILGEDITNTAPMMALSVRQAGMNKPSASAAANKINRWNDRAVREVVQDDKGPIFNITPYPAKLDEISAYSYNDIPEKIAELGFAIAGAISNSAPSPDTPGEIAEIAAGIAGALMKAERPLIISGTGCLNEQVAEAAYNIAKAVKTVNDKVLLSFVLPECNSMGLAMMAENSLDDLLEEDGVPETLIILENDLYRRADGPRIDALLNSCSNVIVFEELLTNTALKASVVVPVSAFAEATGTYVNNEGRAQRFYPAYKPAGIIMESWKWLRDILSVRNGESFSGYHFDEISSLVTGSNPYFKMMSELAPDAEFRIAGMKIARQPQRYSGRTAINAGISVHEPGTAADNDSPLAYTMDGYHGKPPSTLIPYFWAPGWDSNQSVFKYQDKVGGKIKNGDAGIRLLEPAQGEGPGYFAWSEPANHHNDGMFRALPVYHIFGSEELSSYSMPLEELTTNPFAGLNPDDAKNIGKGENEKVRIKHGNNEYSLPLRIIKELRGGSVLIPSGLKNFYVDFYNSDIIVEA